MKNLILIFTLLSLSFISFGQYTQDTAKVNSTYSQNERWQEQRVYLDSLENMQAQIEFDLNGFPTNMDYRTYRSLQRSIEEERRKLYGERWIDGVYDDVGSITRGTGRSIVYIIVGTVIVVGITSIYNGVNNSVR